METYIWLFWLVGLIVLTATKSANFYWLCGGISLMKYAPCPCTYPQLPTATSQDIHTLSLIWDLEAVLFWIHVECPILATCSPRCKGVMFLSLDSLCAKGGTKGSKFHFIAVTNLGNLLSAVKQPQIPDLDRVPCTNVFETILMFCHPKTIPWLSSPQVYITQY